MGLYAPLMEKLLDAEPIYNILNTAGRRGMQIEVKIDKLCSEPKVIIVSDKMSDEVSAILKKLSEDTPRLMTIAGFQSDEVILLEPANIVRIYTANSKVFAQTTDNREYTIRRRLYELEELLDKSMFVRISNSEIVNLKYVSGFDLSLAGTICVRMANGLITYVSRRYVAGIRRVLGI